VLLEQEDWFEDEMAFVRAFARPGMTMLDIGANHGVYSLTFAGALAGRGRVTAYEPTPTTAGFLRASIAVNGFGETIEVVQAGLSDSARTAAFFVGANSELNSLHDEGTSTGQRIEVSLVTLDAEAAARGWRDVDFVKLDAEGEETNVLKGGAAFFRDHSPLVLFELKHGSHVNHHLIAAFNDIGYRTYRLVPGLNKLIPHGPEDGIDGYLLNLFACKDDRAFELAERGLLVTRPKRPLQGDGADLDLMADLTIRPFADGFLPIWRERLTTNVVDPALRRALTWLCLAEQADQPSSVRYTALLSSFLTARNIVASLGSGAETVSIAPHLALARAARMIGARAQAVQALQQAMELLNVGRARLLDPTMPPLPAADNRSSRGNPGAWVRMAVAEPIIYWSTYSTYFSKDWVRAALETIQRNPFLTPGLERRYHLMQLRNGNHCPRLSPMLRTESAEHLNAALWLHIAAMRGKETERTIPSD